MEAEAVLKWHRTGLGAGAQDVGVHPGPREGRPERSKDSGSREGKAAGRRLEPWCKPEEEDGEVAELESCWPGNSSSGAEGLQGDGG